jgi:hypothetical protein
VTNQAGTVHPSKALRNPVSGAGAAGVRAGSPWSAEEDCQLVDGLRSGATIGTLADRHGRTPGALASRLALMTPSSENVRSEAAADWLRERFAHEDYPWQEVLERRTAARRNGRRGARAARLARKDRPWLGTDAQAAEHAPEHVLQIWQELVGFTLAESWRPAFLDRGEVAELRSYPEEMLRSAGQNVFQRQGELRLGAWTSECARAVLEVSAPRWPQVVAAYDVSAEIRRIIDAAVASLSAERRQQILSQRLGLAGKPQTQQSIGTLLGLSRERVRQVQDKALAELRQRHRSGPARRLLADLCTEAETAGSSRSEALLMLAQLALPGAHVGLAVITVAILAGEDRESAGRLAAEAETLAAAVSVSAAGRFPTDTDNADTDNADSAGLPGRR